MIGLLVVQSLRAAGCSRIWAADLEAGKLDLACRLGQRSVSVPARPTWLQKSTARPEDAALTWRSRLSACQPPSRWQSRRFAKGGSVGLVGNITPKVELPLQAVVTRELTIYGSCASTGEYPACLDMIARRTIDVEPLITAVVPLAEAADWFDRLYRAEKGLMKVIVRP